MVEGRRHEWMKGPMDGRMKGPMDERMKGRMDEWV